MKEEDEFYTMNVWPRLLRPKASLKECPAGDQKALGKAGGRKERTRQGRKKWTGKFGIETIVWQQQHVSHSFAQTGTKGSRGISDRRMADCFAVHRGAGHAEVVQGARLKKYNNTTGGPSQLDGRLAGVWKLTKLKSASKKCWKATSSVWVQCCKCFKKLNTCGGLWHQLKTEGASHCHTSARTATAPQSKNACGRSRTSMEIPAERKETVSLVVCGVWWPVQLARPKQGPDHLRVGLWERRTSFAHTLHHTENVITWSAH